jgi:hypothetical protein
MNHPKLSFISVVVQSKIINRNKYKTYNRILLLRREENIIIIYRSHCRPTLSDDGIRIFISLYHINSGMAKNAKLEVRIENEMLTKVEAVSSNPAEYVRTLIKNDLIRRSHVDVSELIAWGKTERKVSLKTNLDMVWQMYLRYGQEVPDSVCVFLSELFDGRIEPDIVKATLEKYCAEKYEKLIKA